MRYRFLLFVLITGFLMLRVCAQPASPPHPGKLFIIGGGARTPELMRKLLNLAQLNEKDVIAVLPMSSAEPDSAYYYFKSDMAQVCSNTIANLNFTNDKLNNRQWLDSLRQAKLIFITGGDQVRFMKAVLHNPVYDAIHYAYAHGSVIAGTSAGAAVMPLHMMTGNALTGDGVYRSTFTKLISHNLECTEGLGLVDSVIIDQHFIVRSRYNRLLTALAAFPSFACIGIDESTAIIVDGKKAEVAGAGQVVLISDPEGIQVTPEGLIKYRKTRLSVFTSGDRFDIP